MNDYFIWNGRSSLEFGIHVSELPTRFIPMERETTTKIPGRSGTLTLLEGESVYDDVVLTCKCWTENENNIADIAAWLHGSGKVTFGNRLNGYYNGRISNQISFDKILRGNSHREFAVNFRCVPFLYLENGSSPQIVSNDTFLTNQGSVYAEPVTEIQMSGDGDFIIGTTHFELNGVNGTIVVDTPRQECYTISTGVAGVTVITSANDKMTGEFPVLPKEGGYVSWGTLAGSGSTITQVKITPNWRTV